MQTIKLGTITAEMLNNAEAALKVKITLMDNFTPTGNFIKEGYLKIVQGFASESGESPTIDLQVNDVSLLSNEALTKLNDIQLVPQLPEMVIVWKPTNSQMKFPAPADNFVLLDFGSQVNKKDFTAGIWEFYATVEDFQV